MTPALPNIALETALFAARVASPTVLVFVVLSLLNLRRVQSSEQSPITDVVISIVTPRRSLILTLLSVAALTYLADGTVVVLRAVLGRTWEGSQPTWKGIEVADVLGAVAFGSLIISGIWKDAKGIAVWSTKRLRVFAVLAVLIELAHVTLLALNVKVWEAHSPDQPHIPELPAPPAGIILAPFLHLSLAALRLLVLLPLYPALTHPVKSYVAASTVEASSSSALPNGSGNGRAPASETALLAPTPHAHYGTFLPPPSSSGSTLSVTPPPTEAGIHVKPTPRRDTPDEQTWGQLYQKIKTLLPYLWPHNSIKLQFLASLCMVILAIGRVVNVILPFTLKELVARLDQESPNPGSPWVPLFLYAFLRFLQGSGGLSAVRDVLWAPVMQYADREMSQMCFDHLLNLSLAFHTKRKTGEVLRILDRGAAINHVFEVLMFNILPTILDITIALGTFFYIFGPLLSGVVFVVMATYVAASITLTKWRTKIRRQMNDRDIVTRGIHTDCLLNYETVKYFGGEAHESQRYGAAIADFQALEWKVIASLNLLNFIQNFIISTGLLVGSMIVAWRVVNTTAGASEFVFFITYLAQLYGPLNTLGYIYRSINQNLVDTERLMNLLNEPSEVQDKPDASDLIITKGTITFENVNFTYDDRTTALRNVSFSVPPAHSVALVGESGSGKSTILRLLFRQYDLKEGQGRILIDGQDIRDITQASLRKAIGVVPQDSVLFNAGIGYNIGYGKFGATQEEIEAAARAAQLHDRIMSFPDGYETKVGERGVRLSGGEKQRVAIARTYLKNAPILAMDEATSALDTTTEKDIQKALQNLAHGRSSISIAHRLSTIVSADIILVMRDGQIVESGSYRELVAQGGMFASMWAEQSTGEEDTALPTGDVKGYDLLDLDSSLPEPKGAAESSHVLAPTLVNEPGQHPFLAPGPAMIDALPPTEAEKAKAKEAEEAATVDKASSLKAPSVPPAAGSAKTSVKAPSVKDTTAPSVKESVVPSVKESTAPSVKIAASTKETAAPSVKETAAQSVKDAAPPSEKGTGVAESTVEDLNSVKDLSFPASPTAEGAPSLANEAAKPTYAEVVSEEPTDAAPPAAGPSTAPVAFLTSAPIAFPTSDDTSSERKQSSESIPVASPPGVTFKGTDSPIRAGTPEPIDAAKRKRTGSQNFQRLARRISIGRRPSAAGSPKDSTKDDGSVKEGSVKDSEGDDGEGKKKKSLVASLRKYSKA